ncbi:TIGR03621 family F420-dependent LLM class oxidoreductase [Geodermatophilus sabuli]|uniref:TIGR03621 family F420-dependent LLM class oxidoreductase n=1 Tax=Geodermatophilus sabuli TaxID=1564158 RepID=A0A7K3W0S2_9ACTN|nr:TIGR03621 family F420-dependent LLM class oxidoreductase [Geodermatophilus sabuli]
MSIPFRFGVLAMRPAATRTEWLDRARRAEDDGFGTFQVSDHFDRSPASPLLTLAAVAQATSSIRLGTLVLDNDFRHPAVLGKELATLDVLCDGRLEVGIGAGWMPADYAVSGLPFDPPGLRVDRLAETLAVLDAVLGSPEPVTWTGEHTRVTGLRSVPAPRQQPRPPLLVGGARPRVLGLAGRLADVVSVNIDVREGRVGPQATRSALADAVDEKVGWVRAAAAGRPVAPELHLVAYWAEVTERPEEAAARRIAAAGLDLAPRELLASPHCLIGPRAQVTERLLQARERWGFSYVTVYDSDAASLTPVVAGLAGT